MLAPVDHKNGPYGAKGFSEGSLIPVLPAIANAVFDAVGVRVKDAPIGPEVILEQLIRRGKGAQS
jgi:CO/xanthine dehydrogenase Mo-binding subunit